MGYLDGMDVRSRTWLVGNYMIMAARYKKGQWDVSMSRRPRRRMRAIRYSS